LVSVCKSVKIPLAIVARPCTPERYQRMNAASAASGASRVQARLSFSRVVETSRMTSEMSDVRGGGELRALRRKGNEIA
jgi:hypothetical protein